MSERISRKDISLMGIGLAVLCCGKLADSAVNGTGSADTQNLSDSVQRLSQIPSVIGHWSSTDDKISEREQEVAGISGYVRRTYKNKRTGYTVNLTVLCGPSGPIAVHPPTACFEGIGYKVASGPNVTKVECDDGSTHAFNKSSFRQSDAAVPEVIRVFWGWGTAGHWNAPANPRLEFRGQSSLYKIYVTDQWIEDPGRSALPQIESFMKDALPVISAAIADPS